jgi:Golgi phosphoprotein 3 (GPP34)
VPETLAEELLLLAHDIRGKCRIGPAALEYGVAGALLSELRLAGRLTLDGTAVVAAADPPLGDPILEKLFAEVASASRTPLEWVTRLRGTGLTDRLLARMVDGGRLETDQHRNYGLFTETWYPVRDIVALWEAHQRVVTAATAPAGTDPRTLALGAVTTACGMAKVLFATSGDWRALAAQVRERTAGDWAAEAVHEAVSAHRNAPV